MHSFHLDLRQNPEHKALLEGVSAALQKILGRVDQHMGAWRSLEMLWMTDKAAAVVQLKVRPKLPAPCRVSAAYRTACKRQGLGFQGLLMQGIGLLEYVIGGALDLLWAGMGRDFTCIML